jgi:UDP-N-acetylmuramoyl-L-alanyl-D-glutamate--2,6-diaminopimelate ligase
MQRTLDHAGRTSLRSVLPNGRFIGATDIDISSCALDARKCRAGDLYVAVTGGDRDGHEDVDEAVNRGAIAILAERLVPTNVPLCIVPHALDAYGRICQRLAGDPSRALHVTAVSGTHGKTVTSMLIASVLHQAKQPVGVTSTIGYSDSVDMAAAPHTTPRQNELANWLARMVNQGCSHAVVEVSNCGLSQRRLAGVNLGAAVLTNLRSDHVRFHGSVMNYRRSQIRVFEHLKDGGFAVINADDAGSRLALGSLSCPVITVGMREDAEVTAEIVERHPSEQTFLLTAGNETIPVRTRMIGDQHVANCLSAAAVGLVLGIDLATVARGLEAVERVPGRMDRIECGQPYSVHVDCADTADRLAVCLNSLRRVTRGKVHCVLGSGPESRRDERALMGRVIERGSDRCVLTGEHRPSHEPLQGVHDVLDGFDRPARAHVIPSRDLAIRWTLDEARAGDAVLIAGCSRTAGLGDPQHRPVCDDVEIARTWLRRSDNSDGDRTRALRVDHESGG